MSPLRSRFLVLSLSLGITAILVGCSGNPKDFTDAGPKTSEEGYYQQATKALKKGQFIEATKQLEALDTYYPTGQYTQQAQLDLMYARFKQSEYETVVSLADRFIQNYPQYPHLDYVYYIRGVANMEQNYDSLLRYTSLKQAHRDVGYAKIAYQNFADLIRRYPSSQYAVDAAQRMTFIRQEIAENEINVARFNLKRKAWIAAIQRARWVLEYFPQTPQVPEAIATMAYAYQKLGDNDNAQQYIRLLQANYPQLVKKNGEVNLNAARHQGSWLNRLTLGILGRADSTAVPQNAVVTNNTATAATVLQPPTDTANGNDTLRPAAQSQEEQQHLDLNSKPQSRLHLGLPKNINP